MADGKTSSRKRAASPGYAVSDRPFRMMRDASISVEVDTLHPTKGSMGLSPDTHVLSAGHRSEGDSPSSGGLPGPMDQDMTMDEAPWSLKPTVAPTSTPPPTPTPYAPAQITAIILSALTVQQCATLVAHPELVERAADALRTVVSAGAVADLDEPLLTEEPGRNCLYPIRHPEIWAAHKKAEACQWHAGAIDYSRDVNNLRAMPPQVQHFVKFIVAFFASADRIVNVNIMKRFKNDVKCDEALVGYGFQEMMENVHQEVYLDGLEAYGVDEAERELLRSAAENIPAVRKKAEWCRKWIDSSDSFAERLIAFIAVEGIFFSGSFCAIFWLKSQGNQLPGLTQANGYIARDEGLHGDFGCLLYSMLRGRLPPARVHEIFAEAVLHERQFIGDALPSGLLGMNAALMGQYIEFVADFWLVRLGYVKLYNTPNPFPFMEAICAEIKGNFFEAKVTEYRHVGTGVGAGKPAFVVGGDF
jgi:ribonucleotide reductase beta subunit family protein with ferritin-like domain